MDSKPTPSVGRAPVCLARNAGPAIQSFTLHATSGAKRRLLQAFCSIGVTFQRTVSTVVVSSTAEEARAESWRKFARL